MCDLIVHERTNKLRVIADSGSALLLAPFASLAPFHMWLVPTQHRASFDRSSDDQLHDLADVLRSALPTPCSTARLFTLLHTAPIAQTDSPACHFYIEILPVLFPVTIVERNLGVTIIDTAPEDGARWLRDAIGR